jgi:hypothetical protein
LLGDGPIRNDTGPSSDLGDDDGASPAADAGIDSNLRPQIDGPRADDRGARDALIHPGDALEVGRLDGKADLSSGLDAAHKGDAIAGSGVDNASDANDAPIALDAVHRGEEVDGDATADGHAATDASLDVELDAGKDLSPGGNADAKRDVKADGTTVQPSALFVVGWIPLTSADSAIEAHLIARGFVVTRLLDRNAPSTTVVADIVLISRTVTSSDIGSTFRTTNRPVLVWESLLYDNMGMVDGNTMGSSGYSSGSTPDGGGWPAGFTSLVINPTAGELGAGLSGTVAVLDSPGEMAFGVPNQNAIKVASLSDRSNPALWAIFAYDAGAQMVGLTAPARRAGFFPSETSPTAMNSTGWLLFDAAITWLMK